jgi:ribose transport system substrate-binding protein
MKLIASLMTRRIRATLAVTVSLSVAVAVLAMGVGASGAAASTKGHSAATSYVATAQAKLAAGYKGLFTPPPTTAPKPKKGVKVWIISCGQASQGCSSPAAAAKAAATAAGWNATVFDGNFGIGDAYDTGIRQAIAAGAKVIIPIGVNCNQAKSGYQAAKAAGVIISGVQSFDCNDPKVADGSPLFTVKDEYTKTFTDASATEVETGRLQADWLIAHTNGKAQVINTYFQGLTGGIYENIGFTEELARCHGCKILDTIEFTPADTSNGVLKQDWASALAKYPQANAGVNISDGIIIQDGLAQAIQSAGRTKTFALVGNGAFAPNNTLIKEGNGQSAAVQFDTSWVAWSAVDEAIRALAHKPAVFEGMGVQVVDKTHNLPKSGANYSAPINYVKDYEKAWGVK